MVPTSESLRMGQGRSKRGRLWGLASTTPWQLHFGGQGLPLKEQQGPPGAPSVGWRVYPQRAASIALLMRQEVCVK